MIEAMKQALEALELMYACYAHPEWISHKQQEEKILAQCVATSMTLRQAIAEAEKQEPKCVVIVEVFGKDWRLEYMSLPVGRHKLYAQQYLYTHPPKREPLTDEEIATISVECATVSPSDIYFARAIEAAHGIKGKS
jgi:hypothetical protein